MGKIGGKGVYGEGRGLWERGMVLDRVGAKRGHNACRRVSPGGILV